MLAGIDAPALARLAGIEAVVLARRASLVDYPVVILGEHGTPRRELACLIHAESERRSCPFIEVDCSAVPNELARCELFGHARGAFSGAVAEKAGLVRAAEGGTLVIERLHLSAPAVQACLLQVVEKGVVSPLGETDPKSVDVRLIGVAHVSIVDSVNNGTFLPDLYYLLASFVVVCPPLRERKEAIPRLAAEFGVRVCRKHGLSPANLSPDAIDILIAHSWPGNLREFENVIEHAVLAADGGTVQVEHLPKTVRKDEVVFITTEEPHTPDLTAVEKAYIYYILEQCGWQKSKAAQVLGIDASTLYRKIERYGLKQPESRQ